jgi:hypothetical protein
VPVRVFVVISGRLVGIADRLFVAFAFKFVTDESVASLELAWWQPTTTKAAKTAMAKNVKFDFIGLFIFLI